MKRGNFVYYAATPPSTNFPPATILSICSQVCACVLQYVRYRHAACGIPAKNTHPSNNNSTVTSEGSSSVVIWGGFAPSFISDEPFADVHVLEVVPSTTPQGNKEAKKKQKKDPWALRWSEVAMAGPPPTPAGSAALAWLGGSVVALFGMTGFCSHAMTFGTNPANLFLPEEKDSSQVAVFRVADYTVANDDEGGDKEALQGEEARDYTWHYDADPYNRNSGDLTKSSKDGGGFVEASSSSFSGNTNDVPYRPAVRCGATANVVCTPSGDVGILVLGGRRYYCSLLVEVCGACMWLFHNVEREHWRARFLVPLALTASFTL